MILIQLRAVAYVEQDRYRLAAAPQQTDLRDGVKFESE